MVTLRRLLLLFAAAATLFGADLTGKWNFVWQTPGGERRSTMTFKQDVETVEALFPDAKEPIRGVFKDGKLSLAGQVHSAEAGNTAEFRMTGTLSGDELKGTGAWGEHELTFTATKAQ